MQKKLIDKDALVAKIERRIKTNKECMLGLRNLDYYQGKVDALNDTISSLDALEVKGVDLEKEIGNIWNPRFNLGWDEKSLLSVNHEGFTTIAKHFFELGMRVNNPITAADRGTAEEIIINLKRVEQDYHIDLTKEMEWLRNKVNERNVKMEQPLISQSDCESCKLYEGFGQCFEHGYNLVENCKDYKKGEAHGIVDKLPLPEKCRACIWGPLPSDVHDAGSHRTCHFVGTCNNFDRFRKREG